jgi:2-dehydropantoate 2-reductase
MATITSACRASVGPIRDLPETRSLAFALIDELGAVARAYGYDLPEAAARARTVLETWPATAKASMARDFERGSRTELEALTGALVRMAAARGVDVPVHRTAYALLKLRQQMQSSPAEKAVGTAADGR